MKLKLKLLLASLFLLLNMNTYADSSMNVSVRLLGGAWNGKNRTSDTEFKSTEGGQLGMNVAYQNGGFYTGLNFQGGEYTYEEDTPDQVTATSTTPVTNDKISRNELDLVFGYYLTKRFSIFMDIKGTSSTWQSNDYKQEFGGVGVGVTGNWPINDDWTLHGSLGWIGNGEVKHEGQKIGKGKSSGLELGALYRLTGGHRLIFGIKSSTYLYEFDNGDEQRHTLGGAYFGYNYAFSL